MAFSSADLSALEISRAAADKPILGHNAASVATLSLSRWTDTITGVHDTAEINDTIKPITRLFDGIPTLQSAPDETKNNYTIYLEFSAAIIFDGILYLNHNLQSEGCTALVLQVGDDEDMTNATTISTIDPSAESTNKRLADLVLEQGGGTARRYTAQFIRVTLAKGGAFDPTIGQIVFLRRRQLAHEPNKQWDPTNLMSSLDEFETRSGIPYDVVRYRGRRLLSAELGQLNSAALQDDISNWYDAANHGTERVVWIDKPNTSPDDFCFAKLDEPNLVFPFVLWNTRRFNLVGKEVPPFLAKGL